MALHGSTGPIRNRLGPSPRLARLGSTQGPAWLTHTAHWNRPHARSRLTQRRLILRTIGHEPGAQGATAGAKGGVASNTRQGPPLLSRLIGNGPSNRTGSRFQAPGGTRLGAFQIMKWNPQSCPASVTRFRVRYDSRVSEMDTVLLRGVGAGCGSKSTSMTEGQVISSPPTSGAQGRTRRSGTFRRRR